MDYEVYCQIGITKIKSKYFINLGSYIIQPNQINNNVYSIHIIFGSRWNQPVGASRASCNKIINTGQ